MSPVIFRRACCGTYPSRSFRGLTWIGWLNLLVVQWLFLRVALEVEEPLFGDVTGWQIRLRPPITGWSPGAKATSIIVLAVYVVAVAGWWRS